jgi:uncharacterized FAD-dependent dehydrogenase
LSDGESAGYSGGVLSAAADGIKAAADVGATIEGRELFFHNFKI